MRKIKVVVVEDSGLMRLLISDIISEDDCLELVGTASNGKEGVEKIKEVNPDVVVTDMIMPDFDGLYLVKQVMSEKPTPIILLSALDRTDVQIFDALKAGAVDFVDKPKEKIVSNIRSVNDRLISKIKGAARADMRALSSQNFKSNTFNHSFASKVPYDIIVIGSSTGGPSAIEEILKRFPGNLVVPVVIAQHMPPKFIASFAERLNDCTPLKVQVGEKGNWLDPGVVYLLSGEHNSKIVFDTKLQKATIRTTEIHYKEFNNPSVDALFDSVGRSYQNKAIGVILTGMGRDGTEGMKTLREHGGLTICQDESSSVVFGMPKSALDSGAVQHTVKLKEIPSFIISCLS